MNSLNQIIRITLLINGVLFIAGAFLFTSIYLLSNFISDPMTESLLSMALVTHIIITILINFTLGLKVVIKII